LFSIINPPLVFWLILVNSPKFAGEPAYPPPDIEGIVTYLPYIFEDIDHIVEEVRGEVLAYLSLPIASIFDNLYL